MLSREQWTKPSLDDFIAWLETKPRNEGYEWVHVDMCACGQYAKSIGMGWFELYSNRNSVLGHMNSLAYRMPRTFGGLLERALAFKAEGRMPERVEGPRS